MMEAGTEARPDRVLVIDDDELTRLALTRALKRLGYDVSQAASGEAGLQMAEQDKHQIILVDLRMPGIDGHTVLRRLQASRNPSAVVVMSGHGSMDDVVDAMRAGAIDFLKKPWSQTELVAAVARGLETYESRVTPKPYVERAPAAPQRKTPTPVPPAARTSAPHVKPPASGAAPAVVAPIPAGVAFDDDSAAPATPPPAKTETFKETLDLLRRGKIPVPPVPKVLREVRQIISRPEVTLEELVTKIEQDQRLAADVVRMANSAAYVRVGKAHDIRSSVSRIGFRQVHSIVETVFAKGLGQSKSPEIKTIKHRVWRRSVAFGMAMRAIADTTKDSINACAETAYLCGLMADVGASFLFQLLDDHMGAQLKARGGIQPVIEVVRANHEEIGADILLQWGFSADVTRAISAHHSHRAENAPRPYATLMPLAAALADEVAGEVDITAREQKERDLHALATNVLAIDAEALAQIRMRLAKDFSNMVGNLG